MRDCDRTLACLAVATLLSGCQPEFVMATDEPIVIQLDITHEVRLVLEEGVQELMRREAVTERGEPTERGADQATIRLLKAAGHVGEAASGYLERTPEDGGEAAWDAVDRANRLRRAEYAALAARVQTSLDAVEAVAGERRIRDAEPGELVRFADGTWTTR